MAPTIRLATEDDAAQILEIYAPFCRDTTVSFETEPPSLDEMRRRIAKTLPSYPWLVCDEAGLVLGYAYGSKHRERAAYVWSADVSVYVREGRRRGGLGGPSTRRSSPSCGSRAITTRSPASPCPTRAAKGCTAPWASSP